MSIVFLDKTIFLVAVRVRSRGHAAMDYSSWPQKSTISSIITMQFSFSKEKNKATSMSDKSVETLGSKIRFFTSWRHFSTFSQNNVDFSISSTAQTTAPTQH